MSEGGRGTGEGRDPALDMETRFAAERQRLRALDESLNEFLCCAPKADDEREAAAVAARVAASETGDIETILLAVPDAVVGLRY